MYTKEVYSEVYSIIKKLGIEYEKKIPSNIWNVILENKSNTYYPQYNNYNDLKDYNIKKESLNIIAFLDLNYWCNEKEANKIKKIFYEKESKNDDDKRRKYNPDDIFKKTKYNEIKVAKLPIEYKKQNIFIKILYKIKSYIKYGRMR